MGESLRSDHRHGFDQPDEENGDTTAGAEVDRVLDQIAALLRANRDVEFCGECLGAALGAGSDVGGAALSLLTPSARFREDQWRCFRCHRTGQVVRAICEETTQGPMRQGSSSLEGKAFNHQSLYGIAVAQTSTDRQE